MAVDIEDPRGLEMGDEVMTGQGVDGRSARPRAASASMRRRIVLTSGARSRPSRRPASTGSIRSGPRPVVRRPRTRTPPPSPATAARRRRPVRWHKSRRGVEQTRRHEPGTMMRHRPGQRGTLADHRRRFCDRTGAGGLTIGRAMARRASGSSRPHRRARPASTPTARPGLGARCRSTPRRAPDGEQRHPLDTQRSDLARLVSVSFEGPFGTPRSPGQPGGAVRLVLGRPDDQGVLVHPEPGCHLALAGRLGLHQLPPPAAGPRGPSHPSSTPPSPTGTPTPTPGRPPGRPHHQRLQRPARGQRKRRHRVQCARRQPPSLDLPG